MPPRKRTKSEPEVVEEKATESPVEEKTEVPADPIGEAHPSNARHPDPHVLSRMQYPVNDTPPPVEHPAAPVIEVAGESYPRRVEPPVAG